jgi:DNA-binding transcriptional LysR family regulator
MSFSTLDLRRLRYIDVLARLGSYTAAATELGLTQSALTRSILTLEEQFSVRIFDRGRSGLRLTAVGRELLRRSQGVLAETEDLARFLSRAGQGEAGEVRFGLGPMLAMFFLPAIISEQVSAGSAVRFSVSVRGATELIELLAQDRIEFYIAADAPRPAKPAVQAVTIGAASVSLVVRSGHPLARRARPTMKDIVGYPIITSNAPADVNMHNQPALLQSHSPQFQIDDSSVLHRITRDTEAILVTTVPVGMRAIADTGLVRIPWPLPDRQPRMKIVAVTHARRTLSPAAKEILARFEGRLADSKEKNGDGSGGR